MTTPRSQTLAHSQRHEETFFQVGSRENISETPLIGTSLYVFLSRSLIAESRIKFRPEQGSSSNASPPKCRKLVSESFLVRQKGRPPPILENRSSLRQQPIAQPQSKISDVTGLRCHSSGIFPGSIRDKVSKFSACVSNQPTWSFDIACRNKGLDYPGVKIGEGIVVGLEIAGWDNGVLQGAECGIIMKQSYAT